MPRTHPWEISDAFWADVEPLIPTRRNVGTKTASIDGGRMRKCDDRSCFAAMVYVLRTGIIGNAVGFSSEFGWGGLNKFDELEGIDWEWQSVDGCQIKAPLATKSAGANPRDREKMGSKTSALVYPALHRRLWSKSA
ncbi:MAG: hypothetical protein Q4D62_08085 [Planctomycetia bacterium]|nr:hypothetical protein [Planctomycetia bacterium]